ncbi:MAG: hypothetical protein HRU33_15415 [Rhodobacteraceae bacterium]|nr:hypothetical protein [Paracoccaceae bacterium]
MSWSEQREANRPHAVFLLFDLFKKRMHPSQRAASVFFTIGIADANLALSKYAKV